MNTSLDKEISALHKKGLSYLKIAQKLSSSSKVQNNPQFCMAYCSFLASCGLDRQLFQFLLKRIKFQKSIPWFYLFLIIKKHELKISDTKISIFFERKSSNTDLNFLLTSSCLNLEHISFNRKKFLNQMYETSLDPIIQIERELRFCQSQKLFQKQEELLKKLLKIDPKNPIFQKQYSNCKKSLAQQVFSEYKYSSTFSLNNHTLFPTKEEKKILQKWTEELEKSAQEYPHLIDDLSVILSNTGFPEIAVDFLEKHLDTFPRKQFFLELLLESHQFFRCLTYAETFFLECASCSEKALTLSYTKAQAYYGLKEYSKAKDILQNLINIQPNNNSAKELLSQLEDLGAAG